MVVGDGVVAACGKTDVGHKPVRKPQPNSARSRLKTLHKQARCIESQIEYFLKSRSKNAQNIKVQMHALHYCY